MTESNRTLLQQPNTDSENKKVVDYILSPSAADMTKSHVNSLTQQTSKSATINGNRNPERMLRNILPGIANV